MLHWARSVLHTLRSTPALIPLMASTAITMAGQGIISPILPLYAETFQVNVALVGMAVSSFGLARLLLNLPSGLAAGTFGRRPVMLAGALVFAAANLFAGLAGDIWSLIFWRFVCGAGSAAFQTVGHVVVADLSTPENRGRLMGYYEISFLAGVSLGPTVGGFMADWFGYASPFFLVAVLSAVGAIWTLLGIPETRPERRADARPGRGFRPSALLRPELFALFVAAMSMFLARSGSMLSIAPLVASQRGGLTAAQIGIVFTGMTLTQMVLVPFTGPLADRIGRRRMLVPCLLVTAVAILALAAAPNGWGFIAFGLLMGLSSALGGPALPAYAADVAPAIGGAGATMGLYRTYGDVGMLIGGPALGWIADQADYEAALGANAALMVVAAALFWVLSRHLGGSVTSGRGRVSPLAGPG